MGKGSQQRYFDYKLPGIMFKNRNIVVCSFKLKAINPYLDENG